MRGAILVFLPLIFSCVNGETQPKSVTPSALDINTPESQPEPESPGDCESSPELCDGIDNDCDGMIDEDDAVDARTWHLDADADGYGTAEGALKACTAPDTYVEARTEGMDCDDGNATIHPGAPENDCTDPIDYNCDGSVAFADADGDGWPACEDCDDSRSMIHLYAKEICDYLDNDCDGVVDENDARDAKRWHEDADRDGFGVEAGAVEACWAPEGRVAARDEGFDCDDTDPALHPHAPEDDCTDPTDYNCDGVVVYADEDNDGWAACEECDDEDPQVHPDATEVCDTLDNNCNGMIDDLDKGVDLSTGTAWYLDADEDGFGTEDYTTTACTAPPSHVAAHEDGFDCNDADASVFPDPLGICFSGGALALALNEHDNLLLPMSVAFSPETRRAYVISLSTPFLAEIDIDARAVKAMHYLGEDFVSGLPRLGLDGEGVVWISNKQASHPALGFDPSTGLVIEVEHGLARTTDVLGLPGGGAIFVGSDIFEDTVAWRVDSAGNQVAVRRFTGPLAGTVAAAEDGYALLLAGDSGTGRVLVVDEYLEDVRECTDVPGGDFILPRADGTLLVSTNEVLYEMDCKGGSAPILYGTDNHELIEIGDEVIVLDREGSDEVAGPNWGQAQRLSTDLSLADAAFKTGKHTGFGAYDPVEDLLWVSSEGTAELLGFDPASGYLEARVQLGVHAAEVVSHPSMANSVWVTGRLSRTLMRWSLTTQRVAARAAAVTWPLSPVFGDRLLFVVDGLSSVIYGLDPDTLEVVRILDAGLPSNVTLMLHSMDYHPSRNSLFLAHGEANQLYEIDAVTGTVVNEWPLPGAAVEDSGDIGRLRVLVQWDEVYVARSTDGWISRFDLSSPDSAHHEALSTEDMLKVSDLRWGALTLRDHWLYYGGLALSRADLTRAPEEDLPVDLLIGSEDGDWVGWDMELSSLIYMNADGEVIETRDAVYEGDGIPDFTLSDFSDGGVAYVGFGDGYLRFMGH